PIEIFNPRVGMLFEVDETPRVDTSPEALAELQPAFLPDGVVTAGNSSQICDGAAAVLIASEQACSRLGLEPRARFVSFGLAGVDPHRMLHGNPEACAKALRRAGIGWDDVAVIEINEAFASVVLQAVRDAGLAERHHVTGVDLSARQVELAREHVSGGTFLHADALGVELESSFDAVVSLYMSGHVPREEQAQLLRRIARWLRPGGHLLMTLTAGGGDGCVEEDWLGAPMFFAGDDAAPNPTGVRKGASAWPRAQLVRRAEFARGGRFPWL